MYIILITSLFVFIASIIQGIVGFGFALISVPLLSLILPLDIIVPIVVAGSLVTNCIIVYFTREHIRLKQIKTMIIFGLLGIPLGVYGLNKINPDVLKMIIGILIISTSIFMIKGIKVKFKNVKISYGIAGFISGFLKGCVSISGPPIVLFLSNEGYEKNEFKANLALYSTIINILTILMYIISGILKRNMVSTIGLNSLAIIVGSFIGLHISKKIDDKYFRTTVLILLILVGFLTIIKSL